jgi:hypothetical protein
MNVLHFAIFMNAYNDLFIFTCHQIPLSLHLSQYFPPQTGPPVKILENKHDVNLRPALVAQVCNPGYSGCRDQEHSGCKPALKIGLVCYASRVYFKTKETPFPHLIASALSNLLFLPHLWGTASFLYTFSSLHFVLFLNYLSCVFLSSVVMLACEFRALCLLGELTHCFDHIDTKQ